MSESYREKINHSNDVLSNLGYDYHGHIFEKTLSPEMYANPNQKPTYDIIEKMIEFLIDSVKTIKLQYSIAHSKNSKNIN